MEKIIQNDLRPTAIRLDSGDLLELSLRARQRLDQAGLNDTKIFASGDLDEYALADLVTQGAQIDTFGVGTALATSKDAPALGGVYKLVDLESGGLVSYRAKFSQEKIAYPGRKQVFRFHDSDGTFRGDIIACADEEFPKDEPLLRCVMRGGTRIGPAPDLHSIQQYARQRLARIPEGCLRLRQPDAYIVSFSQRLEILLRDVREESNRDPMTVDQHRKTLRKTKSRATAVPVPNRPAHVAKASRVDSPIVILDLSASAA